jgi:ABC-type phosphate transport system permease subunit
MAVALILAGLVAFLQQTPQPGAPTNPPIIVKVISPPRDPTGIADVIIGSIGLTGAIALIALLLGVVMAAILYWVRSRNPLSH